MSTLSRSAAAACLAALSGAASAQTLDPRDKSCAEIERQLQFATGGMLFLSMLNGLIDLETGGVATEETEAKERKADDLFAQFRPYLDALETRRADCDLPDPAAFLSREGDAERLETTDPDGAALNRRERARFRRAVRRCWDAPAALPDAADLRVVVAAELSEEGEVDAASIRLIEPAAPDEQTRKLYVAAQRALINCSPYGGLPREKHARWRNIEIVFNSEGMVSW